MDLLPPRWGTSFTCRAGNWLCISNKPEKSGWRLRDFLKFPRFGIFPPQNLTAALRMNCFSRISTNLKSHQRTGLATSSFYQQMSWGLTCPGALASISHSSEPLLCHPPDPVSPSAASLSLGTVTDAAELVLCASIRFHRSCCCCQQCLHLLLAKTSSQPEFLLSSCFVMPKQLPSDHVSNHILVKFWPFYYHVILASIFSALCNFW